MLQVKKHRVHFGECLMGYVLTLHAIKIRNADVGIASKLPHNDGVIKDHEGQPIGLRAVVNMIGGDQAACTIHVLDNKFGISGNMFPHVAHEQPSIEIIPASRIAGHDNGYCLAGIKGLAGGYRLGSKCQRK